MSADATSAAEDIGIRRPPPVDRIVLLRVTISMTMRINGTATDQAATSAAVNALPRCVRVTSGDMVRPVYLGSRLVEARVLAAGEVLRSDLYDG